MASGSGNVVQRSALSRDDFLSKAATEGLFFLSDEQWDAIAVYLPERQRGPRRVDDRIVISGIVEVLKSGCAWRDCPRQYGPYMTIFNRYLRWKQRGLWQLIIGELLNNESLPKLVLGRRLEHAPKIRLSNEFARLRDSAAMTGRGVLALDRFQNIDETDSTDRVPETVQNLERMLAVAELETIVRASRVQSPDKLIEAIVEWHLRRISLTSSRGLRLNGVSEHGTASQPDVTANVHAGRALDDRLRALIGLFKTDYIDAKTRLIAALECLNFYANGGVDGGSAAARMLDSLVNPRRGSRDSAADNLTARQAAAS